MARLELGTDAQRVCERDNKDTGTYAVFVYYSKHLLQTLHKRFLRVITPTTSLVLLTEQKLARQ